MIKAKDVMVGDWLRFRIPLKVVHITQTMRGDDPFYEFALVTHLGDRDLWTGFGNIAWPLITYDDCEIPL